MVFESIENMNRFFLREICSTKSVYGLRCIPCENITFGNDEKFKSDFKVTRTNDINIYFRDYGVSATVPLVNEIGYSVSICYVSESSAVFCCSIEDIDILELEDIVYALRNQIKFVANKLNIISYNVSLDIINLYCKDSDLELVQNKMLLNDKIIKDGVYNNV